MIEKNNPGEGSGNQAYNKRYFTKKFGITDTEVNMALSEIHRGSPEDLEEFLKLKYSKK